MNANWSGYVRDVTQGLTQQQVAHTAEVAQSTIGRWLAGEVPDAGKVIQFCRAFGRNPIQGLIQAGFVSSEEGTETITVVRPLAEYPADELLGEVQRRMLHDTGRD